VVSLAYYFAADVVPGDPPRIEGDGWTHPLEPDFERRTGEVLRQAFHFDCLARTEGFYPVDLHERETTDLDLDWGRLYDLPLAERLGEYLAVPFERVEPELPQWTLTTDVRPDPENVELLPFVAGELSIVRSPETVTPRWPVGAMGSGSSALRVPTRRRSIETSSFGVPPGPNLLAAPTPRRTAARWRPTPTSCDPNPSTRSSTRGSAPASRSTPTRPPSTRTTGDWRPARSSSRESPCSSSVTTSRCARREGEVADLYGLRDMVQFDIEVRHDLTREEMRETLQSDVDFLHYIGHVDDRGMQCTDDYLDLTAEDLDVGVSAFLLNACQSYQQGEALVHRGSRGGIVTLSDVANSPATQLGRIIARLMNSGFNLRAALYVAKRELITGHQYIVVGDGGTTICHSRVESHLFSIWV